VIEDQASRRSLSIGKVEIVKHGLRPSARTGREFEHRAATATISPAESRSVEIARAVKDQGRLRTGAVIAAREAVEYALGPASARDWRQLEYCSEAIRAAGGSGAKKISGRIEDQAGSGSATIASAQSTEGIQKRFLQPAT
jgi:hypothetical protein